LIKQIQTGQVEAATIQGTALDALVVSGQRDASIADQASDAAAFGNCLPEDFSGCFNEEGIPRFSHSRVIIALLPKSEPPLVLALLLRHQVVVVIAPVSVLPWWVPLMWKVAPIWVLFLLIFEMDTTRQWKR